MELRETIYNILQDTILPSGQMDPGDDWDRYFAALEQASDTLENFIKEKIPSKISIEEFGLPILERPIWIWRKDRTQPQIGIYSDGTFISINGFGTIMSDEYPKTSDVTHYMYINMPDSK